MGVSGLPRLTPPGAEPPMTCEQTLLYSQHPRYTVIIKSNNLCGCRGKLTDLVMEVCLTAIEYSVINQNMNSTFPFNMPLIQ